jgi:PmbA protein
MSARHETAEAGLESVRRALRSAASAGADAADAVLVGSESVEARVRGEEIDFVTEAREHILGIRALVAGDGGFRSAITSTSDLSDAAVDRMARDAVRHSHHHG